MDLRELDCNNRVEVDGNGSKSCLMVVFGVSYVEPACCVNPR